MTPSNGHDSLTRLSAWKRIGDAVISARQQSLRERFATETDRVASWRREAAGLTVDLSRHHLDAAILTALSDLAEARRLPAAIAALLQGELVNNTEQRAALHTDLRRPDAPAAVQQALASMTALATRLREGQWPGFSDQPVTDVVNIGIGGSDLGPRMAVAALSASRATDLRVHFVANIDPADIGRCLQALDPARTLFVVASKSFRTQETQVNAAAARRWLLAAGCPENVLGRHFIAITASPERAGALGMPPEQILTMWDWVGGRYSLWSTIGFPIMCAIGATAFRELLAGAHALDRHFAEAPLAQNVPALLGLLDVWYGNFWNSRSVAVLPYSHDLALLPAYLQQLTMESNGKRVTRDGVPVDYATGPVFWGEAGTRGQHSFHQLLHQGTELIPCDFILPLTSDFDAEQHRLLVANCLAQSEALANGRTASEAIAAALDEGLAQADAERLAPHRVMPGNRPSTLITFPKLTPATLGALLACYEHRVYTSAVIWGINPFDQWGVELGKQISERIAPQLTSGTAENGDPLTARLIADYVLGHAATSER
ncbi:MAG: glucose-6-phosphate isomerase [Spongiibacteraceae bacterium]|jgi:glucose-6-phosphate isomerase|nr:glucose-6-phosphate isomerase [Spongiibacteraceae bacterium]